MHLHSCLHGQAVSTGSADGRTPIRRKGERCSEWRCAADASSSLPLVRVHLPSGPMSPAGSGSSRACSCRRFLAVVGVEMCCQPGHRSHLRLGQRRQCGSQRCRPRSEISPRERLRRTAAGAAYGMLACWPVGVGGASRVPFLLGARVRGCPGHRLVLAVLGGGVADVGERPRARSSGQQHDRQRIQDRRPAPSPPQPAAFPARPEDTVVFPGVSGEGRCRLFARLTCGGTARWPYRSEGTA